MEIAFDVLRAHLKDERDNHTCEKTIACFNNAIFSLNSVQDMLMDGIKDPVRWHNETVRNAKIFREFMPMMSLSSILHDLPEVESLPEDPFEHFRDI